jgi:Mrp family chromosome partitioning ATPase
MQSTQGAQVGNGYLPDALGLGERTFVIDRAAFGSCSSVARFVFPAIEDVPETSPMMESPYVVWPLGGLTASSAYAEMAEEILSQLWSKTERLWPEKESSTRSSMRSRVVALTSPGEGDGKTSLVLGLAPQLAARCSGGILVVDAHPHQAGLTARLGMAHHAVSSTEPETAEPLLIYPTNVPGLSVLPASEASGHGFDRSWIEELCDSWPLVLLDTLSLARAETKALVHACDGIYLAVRLGHTSRRALACAAREFRGSGGQLLGCLVVQ